MEISKAGYLNVGEDGVLRSFTADGTVVDYYQLDPDQVSTFSKKQLEAWDALEVETPESVIALAGSEPQDGRLVTDSVQLFQAADNTKTTPVKPREATAKADLDALMDKRQECVNVICQSLSDCFAVNCLACFFPGGPPYGICFAT